MYHAERVTTHAFSWFIATGRWPEGYLCHHCDNPPCVRPDHLYEGDALSNARDCVERGRQNVQRGEDRAHTKLTEDNVREIRHRLAAGATTVELGADFGVHPTTISKINTGRKWRHIE
jgi:hypothetical protein